MRTTKVLLLIGFMIISTWGISRDIYLRFNTSCMDRLEYATSNNSRHVIYQLKKNEQERVVLVVGNEMGNFYNYLPSNTITCGNLKVNESFAREINNGDIKFYIVRDYQNGYTVSPVTEANFFYSTDTEVGYSSSEDYVFVYNLSVKTKGINLATKDSDAKVYYRGTEAASCPTRYYFRKISNQNYQPYTDMIIIPKIGIVESKTGMDAVEANKNRITLYNVNNIPVKKYLDAVCNGYEDILTKDYTGNETYTTTTTPPIANDNKYKTSTVPPRNRLEELEASGANPYTGHNTTGVTTNTSPTGNVNPSNSISNIFKDVDRNLYIDRLTGLPATGHFGGNDYLNGYMLNNEDQLTYTQPSNTGPTYTPSYTPGAGTTGTTTRPPTKSGVQCSEVSTADSHVVQQDETLYSIAQRYNVSVNDLKNWNGLKNINLIKPCSRLNVNPGYLASKGAEVTRSGTDTHIVKKDETLYSISKTYGFTVEKFAEMNGIRPGVRIYPGQRLKTSDCNCPAVTATTAVASTNVPTEFSAEAVNNKIKETLTERSTPDTYEYTGTSNRRVHIVKENDTIYSIAKNYNTSVENLRKLNNLEKTEIIIPFQRIYID